MALEKKKTLNVFKEAPHAWGSYDDYPVGPAGTDPMPYLSRNRVTQPFFVVAEDDQVLVQMSGEGTLELFETDEEGAPSGERRTRPVRMRLVPGDNVYIPGGTPTRVVPDGENIQIRLKAEPPTREAVAWYCASCGELVHHVEIAAGIVHDQYWRAVEAFNTDAKLRTCGGCGAVHPPAELGDIAWPAVAAALRAESAG
jgi:3-hydroxyanthranilate 3,4-dioxygenase